jgi:cyclohexyl-isocyanide hydratase
MPIERRDFLRTAAASLAASPWLARAADTPRVPAAGHDMGSLPASWTGKEQVGLVLYPGFTALDLVGPQHMFASLMGATVHLIARTTKAVVSDNQLAIMPTTTLARAPRDLDILFVPGGGEGTLAALQDDALLGFLADRGSRAGWVSSVCTGSLILGAAGLLKGYQATSHWAVRPLLGETGATPVEARVVRDRNRITGAGVSAGLDLGLTLVGLLRDAGYAQTVQLLAEYAPEPPFQAGTPRTAPPDVRATVEDMFKGYQAQAQTALRRRR